MVQKKLPLINSAHGSETRNIINELIKLFNSMGYTFNESLEKAQVILNQAEVINKNNVDTNERLDREIGKLTTDSEVIDARGDHTVLNGRLTENENKLLDTSSQVGVSVGKRLAIEIEDGPRIRRAIAEVESSNSNKPATAYQTNVGGYITLPKGRLIVNSQINITSWGIKIRGHGRATVIEPGPSFSGTHNAIFHFYNPNTKINDVGIENVSFYGNKTDITLARFTQCRDLVFFERVTSQYTNAPLVVMDRCEEWIINKCFYITMMAGATTNGIELFGCQEGEINSTKIFGWDGVNKTTGHGVYAKDTDELRLRGFDSAFFGGDGIHLSSCLYFSLYAVQIESPDGDGIKITGTSDDPSMRGQILNNNIDGASLVLDHCVAIDVFNPLEGPVELTTNSSKCRVSITGGRYNGVTDNGSHNLVIADHFGDLRINNSVISKKIKGNGGHLDIEVMSPSTEYIRPRARTQFQPTFSNLDNGGLMIGGFYYWIDGNGRFRSNAGKPVNDLDGLHFMTNQNGVSAVRPNNPEVGQQYFDTTINKPIWYTGSRWIDSQSNTV